MRTLIDLPDSQIQALAALGDQVKQPRAALIREAVAEYLLKHRTQKSIDEAFGLWGSGGVDGLEYQDKARAEW
jgi:metal-responsive CopG/Arc/MetJ family transcriptional regulator